MKGEEFRKIREQLGLSQAEFAAELGYTGSRRNMRMLMERYESDRKQIPLYIARLAWLLGRHAVGDYPGTQFGLVNWPVWPGYEFESTPDEEKESTS